MNLLDFKNQAQPDYTHQYLNDQVLKLSCDCGNQLLAAVNNINPKVQLGTIELTDGTVAIPATVICDDSFWHHHVINQDEVLLANITIHHFNEVSNLIVRITEEENT